MVSEICLHNANVLTGYSVMNNCAVLIKDYKIIDVFNEARFSKKNFSTDVKFIDMEQNYIAPGLMDTHIHGIGGYGTDDMSPDSILRMSEILPRFGVTSFIPTLYSAPKKEMLQAIKAVVSAMGKETGAKILGIHLEGPFISPDRLGVQSPDSLSPVNIPLMEDFLKAAKGKIINMTVAPELKGMRELALFCISKGIVLQAGHTNATYEQMVEGMQVRILHTTHLFNAMSRMHHRDPGAVGAVFIHPEMSCELIADGIHINPEFIKFLLRCKPLDKLVLVTDSLKTTKQKKLPLIANGDEVYLDKCFYRKSDNVIAGSALTMIEGVKNLVSFGLTLEQAIQMGSTNPAKILKREHLGLIAPGYDADLVIFDKDYKIKYTIINGKLYKQGKTICEF